MSRRQPDLVFTGLKLDSSRGDAGAGPVHVPRLNGSDDVLHLGADPRSERARVDD